MGGISFSKDGFYMHILEDGQVMSEKMATNCDSCFEPFDKMQMHSMADTRFIICHGCFVSYNKP
jgi:hypothetical protein